MIDAYADYWRCGKPVLKTDDLQRHLDEHLPCAQNMGEEVPR
jgi:hypothetical protein